MTVQTAVNEALDNAVENGYHAVVKQTATAIAADLIDLDPDVEKFHFLDVVEAVKVWQNNHT